MDDNILEDIYKMINDRKNNPKIYILWCAEKTVIQKITVFLCIMKNGVGSYSQMLMKKMLFIL